MKRERIVTQELIEITHKIKEQYPKKTHKWIARFLFAEGYTKSILDSSTIGNMLKVNTYDEYRNRMHPNKGKKEEIKEDVPVETETECAETNCEQQKPDESLLDELRHTNHMLMAMYEEQKNQSRLLSQLIDLWRR